MWILILQQSEAPLWTLASTFSPYISHGLTVRRIKCGKVTERDGKKVFAVATCGNDHTVRVFEISEN
jgi:hypothetical protein